MKWEAARKSKEEAKRAVLLNRLQCRVRVWAHGKIQSKELELRSKQ